MAVFFFSNILKRNASRIFKIHYYYNYYKYYKKCVDIINYYYYYYNYYYCIRFWIKCYASVFINVNISILRINPEKNQYTCMLIRLRVCAVFVYFIMIMMEKQKNYMNTII